MSEPRPVDPAQPDDDAAWQDLIRRFHEPDADVDRSTHEGEREARPDRRHGADAVADPSADGPSSGGPPSDEPFVPPDLLAGRRGWSWPRPASAAGPGPRDHVLDDPDERFEPADPEPISSAEPALALAWCGVGVSIAALLLITLFFRSAPVLLSWALAGVFLLSAGYLVFRLPRERRDDDDGAQV